MPTTYGAAWIEKRAKYLGVGGCSKVRPPLVSVGNWILLGFARAFNSPSLVLHKDLLKMPENIRLATVKSLGAPDQS
jgi:hypothetical protein